MFREANSLGFVVGRPLIVDIDTNTSWVNIYYETTKDSEALDWLDSSLTSSKEKPFLYTQGQAILTRTWIPIQDAPSNRITYSADLRVPKDLMAIMSASNPKEKNNQGEYHFEMKQLAPILNNELITNAPHIPSNYKYDLEHGIGKLPLRIILEQNNKMFFHFQYDSLSSSISII